MKTKAVAVLNIVKIIFLFLIFYLFFKLFFKNITKHHAVLAAEISAYLEFVYELLLKVNEPIYLYRIKLVKNIISYI